MEANIDSHEVTSLGDVHTTMRAERHEDDTTALEDLVLARLRRYVADLKGQSPEHLYDLIMPQLERPLVRVAMELAEGRYTRAASMLGIHRNTLRARLRALGLEAEDADEDRRGRR